MSLADYKRELEEMSDEQLHDEIYHELGFDVPLSEIEEERDEFIKEIVHNTSQAYQSRGIK